MITEPRLPDAGTAALAARLLRSSDLKWRHHGIGLLQAYVVEEAQPGDAEHRLHVWHPSLRLPDMTDSGLMHDHRFDLDSYVLLGAIQDTEIVLHPVDVSKLTGSTFTLEEDLGLYDVYQIEHARSKETSGEGWLRKENADGTCYELTLTDHVYAMGSRYRYPKRVFHRTDVSELTVTLVTKRAQETTPARLLARAGRRPKHAFAEDPNRIADPMNDRHSILLLNEAARLLDGIARGRMAP